MSNIRALPKPHPADVAGRRFKPDRWVWLRAMVWTVAWRWRCLAESLLSWARQLPPWECGICGHIPADRAVRVAYRGMGGGRRRVWVRVCDACSGGIAAEYTVKD